MIGYHTFTNLFLALTVFDYGTVVKGMRTAKEMVQRQNDARHDTSLGATVNIQDAASGALQFSSLLVDGQENVLKSSPEMKETLDNLYNGAPEPSVVQTMQVYGYLEGRDESARFRDPVPAEALTLVELECGKKTYVYPDGITEFELAFPSWPERAGNISKYRIMQSEAPSATYGMLYAGLLGAGITRRMEMGTLEKLRPRSQMFAKRRQSQLLQQEQRAERYITKMLCSHPPKAPHARIVVEVEAAARGVISELPDELREDVLRSPDTDWAPKAGSLK
ncbi:hypothetical protein FOZ61_007672, partial [Perkinsus olseni]